MRERILKCLVGSALWSIFTVSSLPAQVLITGENGGRGSKAVMLTANAIQPDGFGTLANAWVQYGHGFTNRLDGFVSYGNITVFGKSQSYAAIGANIGLLKRSQAGLDVALFNNASFPINHRDWASPVLLGSALIASHPLRIGSRVLTPYGGVSRLTPIGKARDSLFTPPSAVHNGIAGIAVSLSKVTLYFEYNPGRTQKSTGVGILYVFPQRASSETRSTP